MDAQLIEIARGKSLPGLATTVRPPVDYFLRGRAREDEVLLRRLLSEPIEYMGDPRLEKRCTERELFGREARLAGPKATRFVATDDPGSLPTASGGRVPTLSHEQEQHLFLRYNFARRQILTILKKHSGKRLPAAVTRRLLAWGHRMLFSRSTIVRLNMPLVLAMAKRTRLTNIDFNEMISEGNMALLRSVEKFDCSRGYKFSTYSCRAILKSFSRVAMRASRYRGKFPTEFDPAMERSDYIDKLRDGVEEDCVDELKDILVQNLAGLSEVEQTVISERFALGVVASCDESSPKTLEQVGLIIGVTKERVRQIQNNALKKMRTALEDCFLAA